MTATFYIAVPGANREESVHALKNDGSELILESVSTQRDT